MRNFFVVLACMTSILNCGLREVSGRQSNGKN